VISDWVFQIALLIVGILGSGAIWHFLSQREFHSALWVGFSGAVLLLLVVALYIRNDLIRRETSAKASTTTNTASVAPFSAGVRSAMIYDGEGPLSLYMVGYDSMYGKTASPVFYLMHIRIVNQQDIPATIEAYSVAVSANETGPWENLMPIPLLSSDLYALGILTSGVGRLAVPRGAYRLGTPMRPEDMTHAALLNPQPKLESELLGREIQPHKTIGGWAAFDLRNRSVRTVRNYFRITLRDSANRSVVSIAPTPRRQQQDSETDTQVGFIDRAGPVVDISQFHVRYYSDPY